MYKSASSACGKDFLLRLWYLLDGKMEYVHSDNGSEFGKHFEKVCEQLGIPHYFSRPRTPKDHAEIERFNRTVEEEFFQQGWYLEEPQKVNPALVNWLIEYNYHRPHQSLGYLTPMEYLTMKYQKKLLPKVLPMYPTCTKI